MPAIKIRIICSRSRGRRGSFPGNATRRGQPICHALSGCLCLHMFAVGPPRSLLLLLFSVSFSVFFISFRFLCAVGRRRKNAKPRPCLMCKKQPSPSAAFVCCLRPNSGSGHGSSSGAHRVGYRRPSNGPWNVFKLRKQLRVLKLSNASKTRMGNGKKCEMLPAQRREELGVASMEKPLQKPLVPGLV